MASHRKPRPGVTRAAVVRTGPAPAIAALTSVAVLAQPAGVAPAADGRPSLEEIEKKVDDLYRRAESATVAREAARERTGRPRRAEAPRAEAPRTAGRHPESPQDYFDQSRVMDRLASTVRRRQESARTRVAPAGSPNDPKTAKAAVQRKLASARVLLSGAAWQAVPRPLARPAVTATPSPPTAAPPLTVTTARPAFPPSVPAAVPPTAAPAPPPVPPPPVLAVTPGPPSPALAVPPVPPADKAVAFARAQIGKPYVWGAAGPGSYDCSGLTRAAWRAAGVALPRTTYDQARTGTVVPVAEARPGDLLLFSGMRHVGLYLGGGLMVHAPGPGAYVREEAVHHDGAPVIHSVVRPG